MSYSMKISYETIVAKMREINESETDKGETSFPKVNLKMHIHPMH